MALQTNNPHINIDAGEALEKYRWVKSNGEYADQADQNPVGVVQDDYDSGDQATVRLPTAGTLKVEINAAVAAHGVVVSGADGKSGPLSGAATGTYYQRGVALEAGAGDGSIIEIVPVGFGIEHEVA